MPSTVTPTIPLDLQLQIAGAQLAEARSAYKRSPNAIREVFLDAARAQVDELLDRYLALQ